MAERIKGFSIELSLDSMKVDSGLKDLRSSMRLMNSEMRRNMSQFDYDEKSLKKYGVQLDGLKKKYEAQKIVVESARKEYEKMTEKYGENSRQAQNAAANYNQEAASLNNLERHIGSVTKEMEAFRREQAIQSSAIWKTGDALESFGDGLNKISVKARDWGRTLTRRITMPVLGVISAAGGITAAFGWKRLVGLDSAQAQLKGLGYSTKDVGRISEQVTTAIEGGMTTMAEGTAVAAGAMAAGVKEGKELEQYIKLVGDAAVGANRPVDEMAQIFNKVQGQGKLMTRELNQIELSMPGFAQSMSDNLGVSQEEFREMVTAGEISSKKFLDVMDDFAGGMAEAYADSWQGMVANTKAYIGIIGENLLGGVFEKSKESIREFIDIISSESVQKRAAEIGETIGEVFSEMIEKVKNAIKWFRDLDEGQQKLILKLGAFVVALGPLLTGLGVFGGALSKISSGLGFLLKKIAPIFVPLKKVGAVAGGTGKSVGILSRVIGGLTNPIGLTITFITALVASFVAAYKKSEPLRSALEKTGNMLKSIYSNIKDALPWVDNFKMSTDDLKESFGWLLTALKSVGNFLAKTWGSILTLAVNKFNLFLRVFDVATENLGVLVSAWKKLFSGDFKGAFQDFGEGIENIFFGIVNILGEMIAPVKEKALEIGKIIVVSIVDKVKELSGEIKDKLLNKAGEFAEWSSVIIGNLKNGLIEKSVDIVNWAKGLPDKIKQELFKRANIFGEWLKDQHEENKEFYSALPKQIGGWLSDKKESIINGLKSWGTGFSSFFTDTKDKIIGKSKELGTNFGKSIKNQKDKIIDGFKTWGSNIGGWFVETKDNVIEGAKNLATNFGKTIINAKDRVVTAFNSWLKNIKKWFKGIGKKTNSKEAGKEIIDQVKEGAEDKKDDFMGRIGEIILDGLKNLLMIAGVIALSVGRELIKRVAGGMDEAKGFVSQAASDLWKKTQSIFSKKTFEIVESFKKSFVGRIIVNVINFALDFRKKISDMLQKTKTNFHEKINEIYTNLKNSFVGRIITNIINFSKNFRERMSKMWSGLQNTFTNYITNIRNSISNSFVGRMISSITTLKNRFIGLAKDMWGGVRKQFNNIVSGAKGLPKRIGDGIRNARDKATSGMKSVGNSIIRWAGTPFNKVVDGVNWITGKLGVKAKVPTWNYPQYAKGTKGHPEDGPAIVGDKFGRELIKFPDGKVVLSPDTDTLINLPKGTEVIPNRITEKILKADVPHYSEGTGGPLRGLAGAAGKMLGQGARKTKDVVSDIWNYASNPGKLLNMVMDKISIIKDKAQIPTRIVTSGFDYLKKKPLEFIKKAFSESGGGGKPAFGWPVTSPFGYRVHPITGARKLHGGTDFGAPMGSPVPSTTGGTVSYAGGGWNGGFGNLVKVRQGMWEMFYAHLSSILVRAGQSIKKGDILGRVGSTGASTGPHLHYETRKNGARVNPMSLKGFKTGGVIKSQMLAMLGEEGEEIVIPTAKNRRTDAMKLLALAAKKIGADGGSYSRTGSIGSGGDDGFKELLKATVEQNEYLREMVELLMKLLDKDLEAVLAFEPVYSAIKKRMNQDNYSRHKQKRGR